MTASLLFLGGLGAAASLILGFASRVFYVKEDPRIGEVENALPGANCGGCGYAGCRACAEAIVGGKADANVCVVGGFETAVEVGAVMGVKVEAKEPELAWTSCNYGTGEADLIYQYNGAMDCQAAVELFGGSKLCPIGCIGLGSCVKACKFDALTIGEDHLPQFNPNNCVACGACAKVCPKNIISMTSSSRRIIGEYTTDECTAPCQRACPTGIDIPGYIREIKEGHYEEALRIIKEKCPLPLICGRICPAPCELECRRNLAADEPVGINPLKRFVADYEMRTGKHINPYKNPDSDRRTAVVGAGVEGLTAAYYLARLGHAPTLFEAKPQLGGILRYVISPGRLPDGILDHEIEGILEMGVEAQTEKVLGRDFTISSLLEEGFDCVLLTTGGFDSRKILRPGENGGQPVPGIYLMFDFLQALSRDQAPQVGRRVVVAGGGTGALETARACRRLGAEQVTVVSSDTAALLPADLRDSKALKRRGIEVRASTWVTGLWGNGDQLTGAAFEEQPHNGRPAIAEVVEADAFILAAGRLPELVIARVPSAEEAGEEAGDDAFEGIFAEMTDRPTWRTVEVFRTLPGAGGDGVFSGPEPGRTSDASAVIKAILSGRRVVRAIHQHLTGNPITAVPNLAVESNGILNVSEVHDVEPVPRQESRAHLPEPSTEADWTSQQEPPGLSETEARKEAERCLRCGLICYEKALQSTGRLQEGIAEN